MDDPQAIADQITMRRDQLLADFRNEAGLTEEQANENQHYWLYSTGVINGILSGTAEREGLPPPLMRAPAMPAERYDLYEKGERDGYKIGVDPFGGDNISNNNSVQSNIRNNGQYGGKKRGRRGTRRARRARRARRNKKTRKH